MHATHMNNHLSAFRWIFETIVINVLVRLFIVVNTLNWISWIHRDNIAPRIKIKLS